MQINIAICDDNEVHITELKAMIKEYVNNLSKNNYIIYSFRSGEKILEEFKNIIPDIIFMDIELNEKILGTNIGIRLKDINPDVLLIYISGYDYYYNELIQAEPFAFLKKPIDINELYEVLNRAIRRLYQIKQEFIFTYKSNGVINKIDLKDVMYFESQHRIINMYNCNGNLFQFYEKLDDVEKEIEEIYPYFMRPNKSYYVNYNYVERFSHTYIEIDGKKLHITSGYKEKYDDKKFLLL